MSSDGRNKESWKKWGKGTEPRVGLSTRGCPEVPLQAWLSLERLPSYMASFSLWEHLLSFISVSWIYRITLVSVGCRVLASFR